MAEVHIRLARAAFASNRRSADTVESKPYCKNRRPAEEKSSHLFRSNSTPK